MKKIGLIGGISWTSTIDYYKYINEEVNKKLGGLNFANCIIYSLNFNDFQKNNVAYDWEASFKLLLNAAQQLKNSGANLLVLCANTAHIVAEKIEKEIQLPLIHIAEATAYEINKQKMHKVGLLGTEFVMEMDFYKDKLKSKNIEPIIPSQKADREFIQKTLKLELSKGIIKSETKQKYISIINNLINDGAEGIILGCTEIPLIIEPSDISVPVFDTTKIHSYAAVKFALKK